MPSLPLYRIGCPVWACDAWVGSLYSTKNRRRWLEEYSSVFGAVEGNSTFYAMPTEEAVGRWAREPSSGFRFALKTPAAITHERQLAHAEGLTTEWVRRLRQLQEADRLGPTMLQLPPYFAGPQFGDLVKFVEAWPHDLPLAVEPRHADYFDGGSRERDLDALLRQHRVDRVLFDSRALFDRPPDDEIERASQGRKPNPPHRTTVTGRRPLLRFVGRNDPRLAEPWIAEWAEVVMGWIGRGLKPYVFCHSPNDADAPGFCRAFHAALRRRLPDLPDLPAWPGHAAPKQRSLF